MKTLLITPPFSQLNTPYPAMPYLTSFLKEKGFDVSQKDIGIELINRVFSKDGLTRIFNNKSEGRVGELKGSYLRTIDPVIDFLQGNSPTLANVIVKDGFLPQSDRFDHLDIKRFGDLGIYDRARYYSTLYLNDISDYISTYIDKDFGFSRYSERLGIAQSSFKEVEKKVENSSSLIISIFKELWLEKLEALDISNIGITIPFPGNLIPTLLIAKWTKEFNKNINIFVGGGWVNTELRDLNDPTIFKYVDYILLDDGESPVERLLNKLNGISGIELNRTYLLEDGKVVFKTAAFPEDYSLNELPAPTYEGLDLNSYISVIDGSNPMHSLWNNGRWNKITLAHGCYWKRCAFCDITLPYIKEYHVSEASIVVDKIEKLLDETGERGFHFVDEAAPPALLKEIALEILRRGLIINWWTNIRFEKRFSYGLSRLLAKSGCIGVSGGIEVASDRLLEYMDKGVTVEQVATVTSNLGRAGIMVHGYLMYGFPTQTKQETINSMEIVRQLFSLNLLHSAYWHQFSLTAHSKVGSCPDKFEVEITGPQNEGFAENDLTFKGLKYDPGIFSSGLKASLYNYMRGDGLDLPLNTWFDFKIPKSTILPGFIEEISHTEIDITDNTSLVWIGENYKIEDHYLYVFDNTSQERVEIDDNEKQYIEELLNEASYHNEDKFTIKDLDKLSEKHGIDTDYWLSDESASILFEYGLLLI